MSNVADVKIKKVPITIGGKDRTMKFDLNSFAELEEAYGSIEAAMEALERGSIKGVRVILWSSLIHEEQVLDINGRPSGSYKITPAEVGSWVGMNDLAMISDKLKEAMRDNMPTAEETTALAVVQNTEVVQNAVYPNA